ncbi:UDP-N-acetylmuramoyl-L-alanyl-D-glutamate--2,6-diaminopimelate ligase [Klugiella xanthotipulae]|uniref:UDP-N-acetylmuramyl-tripeptide synthetase n=1 Tax=Klugiella xanthotipulae TaxID=244735 RepID=A0A543HSF5_9MICO|nr:UDP-N-acetylmuramoyl-L-alanyl-D-glutamate--2,6-diaminopimelate ligase [Klugiella xanthotipulae]TQM61262.1 UDP-N-acetylmuramoylalanyl-D-glutamate--2,6-diaminopimelate ligase [Klugiella xanthotipulae]
MSITPVRALDLGRYDPRLAGRSISGHRLVQNSRAVIHGDIFVALGSTGADGSTFIGDAIARGASAVLYDASVAVGHEFSDHTHGVHNLHDQLGQIADDFYACPSASLTLVGVTGTNGKTSAVQLISQAWHRLGIPSASIGTLGAGLYGDISINTGLTTPPVTQIHELLAEFRDEGVTHVAIEVSSHALEQNRAAGVKFDTAVFTNLTRDHLDYHHTMSAYAAEKAKIFRLSGVRNAVINLDDPYGDEFYRAEAAHLVRIGLSSRGHADAMIRADGVQLTAQGITCTLTIGHRSFPLHSSLLGRFNVDNLLSCAGVLHAQGVSADTIVTTLGTLQPVFGRMNRIQPDPSLPLVIVDYAHTPDALRQSLSALAEHASGRILTVFGCTGDRDRGKRPEMARIAEDSSDLVIVTDDDVHHEDGDRILDDIRPGFQRPEAVVEERNRAKAIAYAIAHAGPADIVLIAGKGHESYQVVGEKRVGFSDTACAEQLLQKRLAASHTEAG